jgi:hypothetical protein
VGAVASGLAGKLFSGDEKSGKGSSGSRIEAPDTSKFQMGLMAPRERGDDSTPAEVADFEPILSYVKLIRGITKPDE